jgi:hypothetical protein
VTSDDAIRLAAAWVWTRYPVVPPVNVDLVMTDSDKWFVSFFCSWDTDVLGMPSTLNVLVDNASGEVRRF